MELDKRPLPEERAFRESVQMMGAFFGIGRLSTSLTPGKGWSAGRTKNGIEISIDPLQIMRESSSEENTRDLTIRPIDILHTAGHEIGHARDMLEGGLPEPTSKKEHFFWNSLDDTVIDARLRHIGSLDEATGSLYKEVLFPQEDLSDSPTHIQFMNGVLLRGVVPEHQWIYSPEVDEALHSLTSYSLQDGSTVNVLDTLTNLYTTIPQRVAIATSFLLPLYEKFYQQDLENTDNKNDSQNGDAFSQEYEQYKHSMHPLQSQNEQEDVKDADSSSDPLSSSSDKKTDEKNMANEALESDPPFAEQLVLALVQENINGTETSKDDVSPQSNPPTISFAGLTPPHKKNSENAQESLLLSHLAGAIQEEMNLDPFTATDYAHALIEYREVITHTADIFLSLSSYTNTVAVHRYQPRASQTGRRLHPARLINAAMQTKTRRPDAIWQPTHSHTNRQELTFGGLDIHLIVDVSGSMSGQKAQQASACAIILLEALDVAIEKAKKGENNYAEPDVRCQITAFGSSSQTLSPLHTKTSAAEKGTTYYHLLNPGSGSTYITSSLETLVKTAQKNPSRDQIGIIITDGGYSDYTSASALTKTFPDNIELTQLSIEDEASLEEVITPHTSLIKNPHELPVHLYTILNSYLSRYTG